MYTYMHAIRYILYMMQAYGYNFCCGATSINNKKTQ